MIIMQRKSELETLIQHIENISNILCFTSDGLVSVWIERTVNPEYLRIRSIHSSLLN